MDFSSAPLYLQTVKLYLKVPERSISWTTFTDVFDFAFWSLLLGIAFMLIAFYYINLCFSENDLHSERFGIPIVSVLLTLVGMGIPELSDNWSTRILVMVKK